MEANTIPPLLVKAKRKDNGEWVEGNYVYAVSRHFILVRGESEYYKPSITDINPHIQGLWYEIIPETLCWHFGKTDMNGEKLFTGDLIKVPDTDIVVEIYWDSEPADILYRNPKTKGLMLVYTNELDENFIKVGNIHDIKGS